MPIYAYTCHAGHAFDRYLPVARYAEPQTCECGEASDKRICAPMVVTDLPGYQSPVDGRWVEGKRARREDLARNNCVPYEPSMKQEYMKKVERSEQALDKALDRQIEAEIHQMPARKRELLEQELKSGTELQLTRA